MEKPVQDRVRLMLDRKGALMDGRVVLWSPWNKTGYRISILRPVKGSTTVEEKSITVAALRGSEKDQANGIVGRLLANY